MSMPADEQQLIITQKLDSLTQLFELRITHVMDKMEDVHEQVKKTNGRVTAIETWKEQNSPMLSDIALERKDDRKRISDIFWRAAVILLAGAANIENIKKFF